MFPRFRRFFGLRPWVVDEINGSEGNGGAGGLAGQHGIIQIIDLENSTQISTSSIDGNRFFQYK